jgi:hypothetical protein
MRASLLRAAQAWLAGAAALFGPVAVLATVFVTAWGSVAVVRGAIGCSPWGPQSVVTALAIALAMAPWLVKHGWLDRDRR